jgi:tetratricopeptide (TPR) repeat protein
MKPLLALAAMLAATAWSQPREFVELGQKALAAARAGRYQEAIAAYEQMLELDPGNRGVHYDLALALNQLGRNRESLAALGKPAGADALVLAGLNYRALGDLVSAERDLRAAFALEPGPQVAADFGIVLLDRDKHQEAERVFRRYPDEVRCLTGLGLAAYATGRNEEAENYFSAAAKREPEAADIRVSLGDVYFITGRHQDADTAYQEAIRLDPRNGEYLVKAGRNLLRLDQTAAARGRFQEAIRIEPLNSEAHFELGRLAAAEGNNEEAERQLQASAAIDPGRREAHYQLGLLYRRLHDDTRFAASMGRFEQLRKEEQPYRVDMALPALMIEAPREERRWGRYQFPTVSKMADGRLIAFVHVEADSAESYGMPRRVLVSSDDGLAWREDNAAAMQPYGLRLPDGEHLVIDTPPSIPAEGLKLPASAGTMSSYGQSFSLYRWRELSADLRRIFFQRFARGAWGQESAVIDDPGGMRYAVGGRFPRIWWGDMESMPDGSLTAVTYPHILDEGAGFHFSAACWRSTDRGHTWRWQGRILFVADPEADAKASRRDGFTEPAFTRLRDGSLYCVLRTTDGNGAGPMYRTRSTDGGRTWSKPAVIAPNGVMPRLLRLGNGMLVLSSGRPGVQLRFSVSGLGDDWSEPVDVLPPTSDKPDVDSCGYTGLVGLDRDTFLIVYSWFQKPDPDGHPRKAVLSRRIRLRARGPE